MAEFRLYLGLTTPANARLSSGSIKAVIRIYISTSSGRELLQLHFLVQFKFCPFDRCVVVFHHGFHFHGNRAKRKFSVAVLRDQGHFSPSI